MAGRRLLHGHRRDASAASRTAPSLLPLLLSLSLHLSLLSILLHPQTASAQRQTCTVSAEGRQTCTTTDGGTFNVERDESDKPARDNNLETITFRLDGDNHDSTFEAYITPDVSTFYNRTDTDTDKHGGQRRRTRKQPRFKGLFAKFVNLSRRKIRILWQPMSSPDAIPTYISDIQPFNAAGTATYPTHKFLVVDPHQRNPTVDTSLAIFDVTGDTSLFAYDPYNGSLQRARHELPPKEFELYRLQHRSLAFSNVYKRVTGREYIALYGRKYPPRHYIWPADYIGQSHTIVTKETHLLRLPDSDSLSHTVSRFGASQAERDALKPYRRPSADDLDHGVTADNDEDDQLVLNMTVLSVSPRVFEIHDFLSEAEAHHILELAAGMKLGRSTTRAGYVGKNSQSDDTRTSFNSWIPRMQSPVVDSVFRRAADLLNIDEALFRHRHANETTIESLSPICERLQLVHYAAGQQYTPHHDFAVPSLKDHQPTRFATMLLYLNEGMVGGETSFPKWQNADTSGPLNVVPKVGKAILFYNQLPDGNYDDYSQHAALPVRSGEKWLTNLWVWDPFMQ